MKNRCVLALFLLIFTFNNNLHGAFDSSTFNANKDPLKILRIIPSGEDVPPERQIVFTFNRPVVPIGRMERRHEEIPIQITPALNCQWRWLDTTSLACQLDEKDKMTHSTRYTITIMPAMTAIDGSTMENVFTHRFITQRPKIKDVWFKTWSSPGMPFIYINFDQPVTKKSVEKHLYIISASSGRRKALTVSEDEDYKQYHDYKPGYRWIVSPEEELLLDEMVDLWVEPGIISTWGEEKGVEDRIIVGFYTFPEFRFIGMRCSTGKAQTDELTYYGNEDLSKMEKCNPLSQIGLLFSSPVEKNDIKEHIKITPDIRGGRTDYDPWENIYVYRSLSRPHNKGNEYAIPLPEIPKANETYHIQANADKIKDMFGRTLKDPIDIKFLTDHRLPDYHLSSNFFVLEKNIDSEVPLIVTNLDEIIFDYKTLTSKGMSGALKKTLTLDKAEDIAYKIPLKTREMIPAPSGIIYAEFKTLPHAFNYNDWFFSQITPYNVHVKIGHFNTIVWVTDFSTGMPVDGVNIDIYKDTIGLFTGSLGPLAKAITNAKGMAILPGTEKIDPDLDSLNPREWDVRKGARLFVRCQKGADMAVVPLIYEFEVREGNYYEDDAGYWGSIEKWSKKKYGHIRTWGITAQGIYRAGDTVQYKFYVRNQENTGFIQPPLKLYNLKVIDPMDRTIYEKKDIILSEFGSYEGEFIIPKTGAVGWYRFALDSNFTKDTWEPMRVLVSDFTPSPFKVLTDLNGEFFKQGDTVKVQTSARLHAGGPYANAASRITATLKRQPFMPKARMADKFSFDVYDYHNSTDTIYQTEAPLNDKGDLISEFKINHTEVLYGALSVESAVRDDRGKYIANQASAAFAARDRYVGIYQKDWTVMQDTETSVSAFVVDEYGNAAEGVKIELTVEYRHTTSSRVKGAGNAYIAHYNHEWVKRASCELISKLEPVNCAFTPTEAGAYRMKAVIADTLGRPHESNLWRWAVGKGMVVWEAPPDNTLNIFPEKQSYSVGDTARYLVQNPFPDATALITIERYGIIKSWIKTFKNSTEIIEFPVLPEYIPGYYLSVVVTSPRVKAPIGEEEVDLGKPSFKMGYIRVEVKDPYKEILIKVKSEKEIYKPRDTAKVNIEANMRQPAKIQSQMELVVVVIDEAVFDLLSAGRNYFDPYKGFYYLEPRDVKNYAMLMQLVGRQMFAKKGAAVGGDGGFDISMRSIFKFVSYWNPSLKTDLNGKATIEFQVPDNLTAWKVLVMAVNKTDRMGLGDTGFKVNRPTEIRPALPNQATEGDSFTAGFTVMNRTDSRRAIRTQISAEGAIENTRAFLETEGLIMEPYKRYMVWLPVKTKGYGEIKFNVIAGDDKDRDGFAISMPVLKRPSIETAAAYGTTTMDSVIESIVFPKDMRTDSGGVSITVSPSIIGSVEGAFSYMRDYPYACWEQVLTKGVMASHYLNLKQYMPEDFKWKESAGLPEKTIALAREYQAPNGGMTYYKPEDAYVSPYLSAYTAISLNWLRQNGYLVPEDVENRLHDYLLKLLRQDVFPDFYSKGMASTVRAVALSALSERKKINLQDVTRYRQHLSEMSLFGKAHYLNALVAVPDTQDIRQETLNAILSHANVTAGKFIFSEIQDLGYERIHSTAMRDNCAVLSALISYAETPQGKDPVGDIPFKLGHTIRETRGGGAYWENTQENIFCMNALIDFSRLYEREKPDMTLKVLFDAEPMGEGRFTDLRNKEVRFERPIQKIDPGRAAAVKIERKGRGRIYYSTTLSYAPLELKDRPINSGIELRREYSVEREGKWVLLSADDAIKTGELVKVDLYASLPAARNFVVVDDPVPGGLEPVNKDLATASLIDASKDAFNQAEGSFWFTFKDWKEYGYTLWSFYHKELRHHAARFYSEYLPAGNYHLSYTAQAIAPGNFIVMPAHAEEMYKPDVFGKSASSQLRVEGQ